MQVSIEWLKEFVEIKESPLELGNILTMLGLEAEETINYSSLNDLIIARILEKTKHPNADKLSVCQIYDGVNTYNIVCGAPNVEVGKNIVFAPVGTTLPDGIKIKKTKIRGELSWGMICSERELGLSENHTGIMILPDNLEPGSLFVHYLQESQTILDLDITPNRPDCFSHVGVARDLAVKMDRDFNREKINPRDFNHNEVEDLISIKIDDTEGCPRYVAGIMKNVRVKHSPLWMVKRLEAIGLRSINNIVDISNYVLHEMGHPTHIFDFNKLYSNEIVVRRARNGEQLQTLDEITRTLSTSHLLITNGSEPIALAGIMGGLDSAVNEKTHTVLIESAYFHPPTIRRGAKSLGISTDASKRFERGADPEGTLRAFWRVIDLLEKEADGIWVPGIIDIYPKKIQPKPIQLSFSRIKHIAGCEIPQIFIEKTLKKLGLTVRTISDNQLECTPPSYRPDLVREIDLIEEIIRVFGYENIPITLQYKGLMGTEKSDPHRHLNRLQDILNGLGFFQCFNNSLQSKDIVGLGKTKPVKIMNPLTEDMTHLRTTLLAGLLDTVNYNIKIGRKNLRLYEWGNIFEQISPGFEGIKETMLVSGLILGNLKGISIHNNAIEAVSFHAIKGFLDSLLNGVKILNYDYIKGKSPFYSVHYHIIKDNIILGSMGEIDKLYIKNLKLYCGPVFAFELFADPILSEMNRLIRYAPIIIYPKIERDLNFVVDDSIEVRDIVSKIRKNGGNILKSTLPINIFHHADLGDQKKSITFRLVFQSAVKTLEDEDVTIIINDIVSIITKQFNAKLR